VPRSSARHTHPRAAAAVARALFLTERTVETHVRHIHSKLDVAADADQHRRVLAVLAHLRGAG